MWYYRDQVFTDEMINDAWGFVYLITHLESDRKYIGKKQFYFKKVRQVKGKKKRFLVDSDWLQYYGSNIELQEDVLQHGSEKFKREILHICKSKGECSYLEAYEQFVRHALLDPNYYNSWISVRVREPHIKNLISEYNNAQLHKEN